MAPLSRTTSQESTGSPPNLSSRAEVASKAVEAPPAASSTRPTPPPWSRTPSHTLLHSSLNSPITNRKSRFADAGTTEATTGRASISMPPPATKPSTYKPAASRRPSSGLTINMDSGKEKSPDSSSTVPEVSNHSTVIEDHEKTPNIQSLPASEPCSPLPPSSTLKLPLSSATTDTEGNRSSFPSLYSLGSAIYNGTIGSHSAPPSAAGSNAGSVRSGTFDHTAAPLPPTRTSVRSDLSAPTTTATDPVSVTANAHTQLQGSYLACCSP